jgi:hypothetical protein
MLTAEMKDWRWLPNAPVFGSKAAIFHTIRSMQLVDSNGVQCNVAADAYGVWPLAGGQPVKLGAARRHDGVGNSQRWQI